MSDLAKENANLRAALAGCVDLLEAWAYGPILKAGIEWPVGVCTAPALVRAKTILAEEASPSGHSG